MEPWTPRLKVDVKEIGHWQVGTHEVVLEQRVTHEKKYPWNEERAYADYRASCLTCYEGLVHFDWIADKTISLTTIEQHIEEFERSQHVALVLDEAKLHQAQLQ